MKLDSIDTVVLNIFSTSSGISCLLSSSSGVKVDSEIYTSSNLYNLRSGPAVTSISSDNSDSAEGVEYIPRCAVIML